LIQLQSVMSFASFYTFFFSVVVSYVLFSWPWARLADCLPIWIQLLLLFLLWRTVWLIENIDVSSIAPPIHSLHPYTVQDFVFFQVREVFISSCHGSKGIYIRLVLNGSMRMTQLAHPTGLRVLDARACAKEDRTVWGYFSPHTFICKFVKDEPEIRRLWFAMEIKK